MTLNGRASYSDLFYDSWNYLAVTYRFAYGQQVVNALRTPVYPGYLATFVVLHIPHPIAAAITGQIALLLLAAFELYALIFRLAGRQWVACLGAALVGSNVFILQWERAINSEGLTIWELITLFLLLESYLRKPQARTLAGVTALLALIILTRPFYIFLPVLVFGCVGRRAWRMDRQRADWKTLILAATVLVGMLLAYMTGNKIANGYFGLSSSANINLFGKVLTYHLRDDGNPRYARLNAEVASYTAAFPQYPNFVDPWPFVYDLHPEYNADGQRVLGAYSRDVILRHPVTFVAHQVADIGNSSVATPALYGGPLAAPGATVAAAISEGVLALVAFFLPIEIVIGLAAAWRRPEESALALQAILLLALGCGVVMIGGFSYDPREYYRLRAPLDWALITATVVMLRPAALALWRASVGWCGALAELLSLPKATVPDGAARHS